MATGADEPRIDYATADAAFDDTGGERSWPSAPNVGPLDLLAGRLQLPDPLVDHIEATVSAAKEPVPVEPSRSSVPPVAGEGRARW